jgi:hypothetical protein
VFQKLIQWAEGNRFKTSLKRESESERENIPNGIHDRRQAEHPPQRISSTDTKYSFKYIDTVVLKLWGVTPKGGATYFPTDKN